MLESHTERLLLTQFSCEDIDGFYQLNSEPDVLMYTGDKPFANKQEVAQFIANYDQYQQHGFGRWSLYLKHSHHYIGFCGLRKSDNGEIDLGFRLLKDYWRQGYAYEAAYESLRLAFTKYNATEIIARAMQNNIASLATIKKLGFCFTNHFDENEVRWSRYALTKTMWLSHSQQGI